MISAHRVVSITVVAASVAFGTNARADDPSPSSAPMAAAPSSNASFGMDPSARIAVRDVPPRESISLPPNVMAARRISPLRLAGTEYLVGAAAAAVTVPLTLALGTWLGSLSNDLVGAALPSLLLFTLVPAFMVTGAEVVAGNMLVPGVASMHPAIWPALATTIAGIAVGSLAGVSIRNAASFTVFSLVMSLVLPAGVTLVLHARRPQWAVDGGRAYNASHAALPNPLPVAPRVVADMRRIEDPYAAHTFSIPLVMGTF